MTAVFAGLAEAMRLLRIAFHKIKESLMATLDDLQTSVERLGSGIREGVTLLGTQREKIAVLEAEVNELRIALTNAGEAEQLKIAERISALVASVDADADAIAKAVLIPAVEDPNVPTEEVEAPAPENPDTVDPGSVEGSVPAGDPAPAPEIG